MFNHSDSFLNQPSSLEGSLFSEVHINEIKKFERKLDDSKGENRQLNQRLMEAQSLLDKTQAELKNQSAKVDRIFQELTNLNLDSDDLSDDPEINSLRHLIKSKLANLNWGDYKEELAKLQGSLDQCQSNIKNYEQDCETLSKMLNEFFLNYNQSNEDFAFISDEFASIYQLLCLGKCVYCCNLSGN